MDPIIRTIYFAQAITDLDKFVVVDIEEYSDIKRRWDPNAKGRYFLIGEGHHSITDKNNRGSVQDFINYCYNYRPPVAKW